MITRQATRIIKVAGIRITKVKTRSSTRPTRITSLLVAKNTTAVAVTTREVITRVETKSSMGGASGGLGTSVPTRATEVTEATATEADTGEGAVEGVIPRNMYRHMMRNLRLITCCIKVGFF